MGRRGAIGNLDADHESITKKQFRFGFTVVGKPTSYRVRMVVIAHSILEQIRHMERQCSRLKLQQQCFIDWPFNSVVFGIRTDQCS